MARERNGEGTKGPGSKSARDRFGQGVNQPESYWPILSGERIGPGAKRLGTGEISILVCNRGGKTDDAKWLMETLIGWNKLA